jgi:hypothetical protein
MPDEPPDDPSDRDSGARAEADRPPPVQSVESAAELLHAGDPGQFVAARGALAKAAKAAGDPALARAIAALRRPTTSAWAMNALARDDPAQLRELLDLGAQLREAKLRLDGAQIAALAQGRHPLIRRLLARGAELAALRGVGMGDATARELEATLEAAVIDGSAAAAATSGRLARSLVASGLDPVDLTGAVGGVAPGIAEDERAAPVQPPGRRLHAVPSPSPSQDANAATDSPGPPVAKPASGVARAEREAQEAHDGLVDAEAATASAAAQLAEARAAIDRAALRRRELEAALAQAQADEQAANSAARVARRRVDAADRRLRDAQRHAIATQRRLDALI